MIYLSFHAGEVTLGLGICAARRKTFKFITCGDAEGKQKLVVRVCISNFRISFDFLIPFIMLTTSHSNSSEV
jgi:hypothetical protein